GEDERDHEPQEQVGGRPRPDLRGQILEMGSVHGKAQAALGRMICFSTLSRGPSETTLPLSIRMIRSTSWSKGGRWVMRSKVRPFSSSRSRWMSAVSVWESIALD